MTSPGIATGRSSTDHHKPETTGSIVISFTITIVGPEGEISF